MQQTAFEAEAYILSRYMRHLSNSVDRGDFEQDPANFWFIASAAKSEWAFWAVF